MSTPNDTLRARLEAIRERHYRTKFDECGWCCGGFPCPNYTDAVAALVIVDRLVDGVIEEYVRAHTGLVPDPAGADL